MADDPADCARQLKQLALELGFAELRITSADGDPRWRDDLTGFLAEGRQGSMDWLAERTEQRLSPRGLWPDARSVLVLGETFAPAESPLGGLQQTDCGLISVYARHRDYHDVLKKRLKALARALVARWGGDVKVFTDTAPVLEKPLAARAGLGWQGRNTHLVSRRFGSWLFLGELYTTLELPPDPPEPVRCGRCTACETVCPTGALQGGQIEPRRCLSYLTIECKDPWPEDLRRAAANRIYGCDDCTAICPWNKFAPPTPHVAYQPLPDRIAPPLADLVQLDDAGFRTRFTASPIKRIGRDRFIRNVLYALANDRSTNDRPETRTVVQALCADPAPLVADAARWVLSCWEQDAGAA